LQVVVDVRIRLVVAQRARAHFRHLRYIINREGI